MAICPRYADRSAADRPFFRSELQARLLAVLLLGRGTEVTASELREHTGGSRSGIHKELQRLLDAGVLERRTVGRSALYRAAADSPITEPLTQLVERTVGVEPELRARLSGMRGIEAAAIHGSWAGGSVGPTSDVDVLVIGNPDPDELERELRAVERLSRRDLNLALYDREDWLSRVRQRSGFASTVLDRPLIELVGKIAGRAT